MGFGRNIGEVENDDEGIKPFRFLNIIWHGYKKNNFVKLILLALYEI
jgi:hypothetical protein